MSRVRKCDCHLHHHQVCDLCCGGGKGWNPKAKDKMPRQKKLPGRHRAFKNAPVHYQGRIIGRIEDVHVEKLSINVTVRLTHCYKCGKELKNAAGIGPYCPNKKCDVLDDVGRFNVKEVY